MTNNATLTIVDYEKRKKLGIFYTPPKLTEILCEWAIRNQADLIFEPSFGGCGFLESSHQRLKQLHNKTPVKQLYGCDIDENAFQKYLLPKYQAEDSLIMERFKKADFLNLTINDFSVEGFSSVVGNPPYVSYHKMSKEQRLSARLITKNLKLGIDGRASLWAYFTLHSLSFLKKGGRLAFVLPGIFLHSNYAKTIREKISSKFNRAVVFQVGERLFSSEGTEENTTILLADGFSEIKTSSQMDFEFVAKIDDLKSSISLWDKQTISKNTIDLKPGYELLPEKVLQVIEKTEKILPIIKLGDIANILIGVVTGSNKFFIIDKKCAELWTIPEKFQKPIFPRFKLNNGIRFTINDWETRLNENHRCIFIDTRGSEVEKDELLDVYLDSFPIEERDSNVTFGKRPIWHQPQYMDIPDAFFPYMNNLGPRIILNDAKTLCTNTIHRVFLKKIANKRFKNKERKLLAITILSTYSQLLAELEGRVYGSGAIKHEPSEAKRIKIIFPKEIDEKLVEKEFNEIDKLFRKNLIKPDSSVNELVRKKVDNFLINHFKIDGLEEKFATMENELIKIRNRRK